MADVIIADGFAAAVIRWNAAGKAISCTLGLDVVPTQTAQEAANDLYDSLTVPSNALCKASNMRTIYQFVGCDVTLNTGGVLTGASSTGSPVTGTAGSTDAVLNSTTCIFRKRTALIGRKHRGRMFVPGLLIEDAEINPDGSISSTGQSIQNATFQASATAMFASTVSTPALLHSVVGLTPDAITSFVLAGTIGVQKRRLSR